MKTILRFAIIILFYTTSLNAQMSGTYTVNPSGGDFSTLTEMALNLNAQGVNGNTTIIIAPGTYTEKINLEVPGLSGANLLTIKGQTGNPNDVIIEHFEDDVPYSYVVRLRNMKNVSFKDITFDNSQSNQSSESYTIFRLSYGCFNIKFDNNKFLGPGEGEGTAIGFGIEEEPDPDVSIFPLFTVFDNLTITDNYFEGFTWCISNTNVFSFNDPTFLQSGINISNNTFQSARIASIKYTSGLIIHGNTNSPNFDDNILSGIAISFSKGFAISNNASQGISINSCTAWNGIPSIVKNNFSYSTIGVSSSEHVLIAHNTVVYQDNGMHTNIAKSSNNTNVNFTNNIFVQTASSGTLFYHINGFGTSPDLSSFSHNSWYSQGAYYMYTDNNSVLVEVEDYTEFINLFPDSDNNFNVLPTFADDANLHVASSELNVGIPLTQVTTDIDDEPRSETEPTLGADEIEPELSIGLYINSVVTENTAQDGQGFLVTWEVANLATYDFYSPWEDKLWLSTDTILDDTDLLLDSLSMINNAGAGETYTRQAIITLPYGELGTRYIIARVDSDHLLFEDPAGNTKASAPIQITLSPKADLVVSNIITTENPFSGTEVTVQWTVMNQGTATTSGGWTDKLYLDNSQDIINNIDEIIENAELLGALPWSGSLSAPVALAPGQSYTSSITFELPVDMGGEHYFLIHTDANNAIEEGLDDDNNQTLSPEMFVVQSPLSDLVVTEINVPTTSFAGETIEVTVVYKNVGNAQTIPTEQPFIYNTGLGDFNNWHDYIYLTDTTFIENLEYYTTSSTFNDTLLLPGEFYERTYEIQLPSCQYGDHYIYAFTDPLDQVEESVETNNLSISDSIEVILNPISDLEIVDLGFYNTELYNGTEINVHYNVINNGPIDLSANDHWTDQAYLSPTDTINPSTLISIGTFSYDFDLLSNSTYYGEISGDIPIEVYGDMYLLIFTDAQNEICEKPLEDNNHLFIPISIQLTPAPDLELVDWDVPTTIIAGASYEADFIVQNTGAGSTINGSWSDKIQLSSADDILVNNNTLDERVQSTNLSVNDSYQWTNSINIPNFTPEGTFHLHYIIDSEDQEFEDVNESNNINTFEIQITHDEAYVSDLETTNITADQPLESGTTVDISFEVINTSLATTTALWYDKVYLKNDNGVILAQQSVAHNGYLGNNESYSETIAFNIPDGLDGVYDIIVTADTTQSVIEYELENNTMALPVTISLVPSPNLVPTSLVIPNEVNAGQFLSVNYIGVNMGASPIPQSTWTDRVFLSLDNILDDNDILLSGYTRDQPLGTLEPYQLDSSAHISLSITGNYFVIVHLDANDEIYEHNDEADNYIVSDNPVSILPTLPVEFDVTIDPIDDFLVDDNYITVTLNVTNVSANDAEGGWINTLYLSDDPIWDYTDQLLVMNSVGLGQFDIATPLNAGESYTEDILIVPNSGYEAGTYYVIVKYDALNYMNEVNESNNTFVAPVYIDNIPLIFPDIVYENIFRASGDQNYFKIDVPENKGMLVKMRHQSLEIIDPLPDDNPIFINNEWILENSNDIIDHFTPKYDISVSEMTVPTPLAYDYTTTTPLLDDHDVLVSVENYNRRDYIRTNALYIPPIPNFAILPIVNNYNSNYTLEAEFKEFSMHEMIPDSAGNSHNITIAITGFDFNDSLHIELRNEFDTIVAYETYVNTTEQVIAYFDTRTKAPGTYGLYMEKVNMGTTSYAPDVFELHDGGEVEGFANVEVPAEVRFENGYTAKVVYGNQGMVNGYDYMIVVAVYRENGGTDSLHVSFTGAGRPKFDNLDPYDDDSQEVLIYGEDPLIDHDDLYVYSAYIPVFANNTSNELFFDIKVDETDTVWVETLIWQMPRTEFTVTGRLSDYDYSIYPYMLDSIIVEDLGIPIDQFGGLVRTDCSKELTIQKIMPQLKENIERVAKRDYGGKIGVFHDFFQNIKKVFTTNPDLTNLTELKDRAKAAKSIFDIKQKLIDSEEDRPFQKQLKLVFDCINPDNEEITCQIHTEFHTFTCNESVTECFNNITGVPTTERHCEDDPPVTQSKKPTNNRGAIDPNEIVGPSGDSDLRIVEVETNMPYTIYFENTSDATAPAAKVRINNPIPAEFKTQSFVLTGFGFGELNFELDALPYLQQEFDLGPAYNNQILRVVAGMNTQTQTAFWEFTTLDPNTGQPTTDPSGGFLPPNDTTRRGQGWVKYEIVLKQDIDEGTQVNNQASIIFDQNAALNTNTWTNTIGKPKLASIVNTLPAYSNEIFTVSWKPLEIDGLNIPIDYYSIYYRKDDGEWNLWKSTSTQLASTFEGETGHTYQFKSLAYAESGISEVAHATFDAQTTIQSFALSPDAENPIAIYPVPTNDVLFLQYYLESPTEVVINVYDAIGRVIMTLDYGMQDSGIHNDVLDDLPEMNGVILVELFVNGEKHVQRGVIMK